MDKSGRHEAKRARVGELPFFSMGLSTHCVPMSMYATHRAKLVQGLQAAKAVGVVLLQGVKDANRDDTDRSLLARQESYFAYLFGVTEPDCYATIDIANGTSTLFIPRLPAEYAIWMGKIQPPSQFQKKYAVGNVKFVDELEEFLQDAPAVHVLHGQNSDSKAWASVEVPKGVPDSKLHRDLLLPAASEARVVKSPAEVDVLRYVAKISSQAHVRVMQQVKPGMAEYQLEAIFQHYCYYYGGCRQVAYMCICATGDNSSVLHYGHAAAPNDRIFHDGEMALMDMGGEYACYCADITCSFPVNGKFTADQRLVYEAVLDAQRAVFAKLKPGVEWVDMHLEAERAILAALKAGGLLQGSLDDMMAQRVGATFMPHGLGHLLGLDTHDVGGYSTGKERIDKPGLRSLRMNRTIEAGMFLTVEPGCYFIDYLLDEAMSNESTTGFFVADKVNRFRGFGGVRLEDDVLITSDGNENFTICPRTVDEVEAVMAGAPWPPFPVVNGNSISDN